jgi:hypothetical protein
MVRIADEGLYRAVLTIFTDQIERGAASLAKRKASVGYSAEMAPIRGMTSRIVTGQKSNSPVHALTVRKHVRWRHGCLARSQAAISYTTCAYPSSPGGR